MSIMISFDCKTFIPQARQGLAALVCGLMMHSSAWAANQALTDILNGIHAIAVNHPCIDEKALQEKHAQLLKLEHLEKQPLLRGYQTLLVEQMKQCYMESENKAANALHDAIQAYQRLTDNSENIDRMWQLQLMAKADFYRWLYDGQYIYKKSANEWLEQAEEEEQSLARKRVAKFKARIDRNQNMADSVRQRLLSSERLKRIGKVSGSSDWQFKLMIEAIEHMAEKQASQEALIVLLEEGLELYHDAVSRQHSARQLARSKLALLTTAQQHISERNFAPYMQEFDELNADKLASEARRKQANDIVKTGSTIRKLVREKKWDQAFATLDKLEQHLLTWTQKGQPIYNQLNYPMYKSMCIKQRRSHTMPSLRVLSEHNPQRVAQYRETVCSNVERALREQGKFQTE